MNAILRELPKHLTGLMEAAYLTGWRVRSELARLKWADVDWENGVFRIYKSKNGEGRVFPFGSLSRLKGVLERQRQYTRECQRKNDSIVGHVFHRNGNPIRDCYTAWRSACERAGLRGKIPHDFRRTAVRNLERAGVPRSVAKKLTGHKTDSIYERYAITTERDLAEGVVKLASLDPPDRNAGSVPNQGRPPRELRDNRVV